ncbi:signal peptidase I [Gordonia hydrophobica]|uniref:Signal peptidase I n=1 Tax=Gordonia hydrophobica TaxID=40516 RepID=A0ABZ2U390_9ACTN|nr:signal peptidase I [Gordonia hydrophobica]MBM7367570.1 signal peptidase I [Gordonia hydrophobica]
MADNNDGDLGRTPEGDPLGSGDDRGRDEERAEPSFTFKNRDADDEGEEKDGKSHWIRETAIIVAIVLVLMFVFTQFFFRQYVVPSESMEPTLIGCAGCSNDRIVIDKMVYRFGDPEPGDVVVFKAPTSSWDEGWSSPRSSNAVMHTLQDVLSWFALAPPDENNLVKRVIAVGGQTVECREASGKGVTVNGKALNEPYINKDLQAQNFQVSDGTLGAGSCYGSDFGPITVPEGNVWVMGDNRSNSADSRAHIDDELHGTVPVSDIRGKVRTVIYPFSRIGGVGAVNPQG